MRLQFAGQDNVGKTTTAKAVLEHLPGYRDLTNFSRRFKWGKRDSFWFTLYAFAIHTYWLAKFKHSVIDRCIIATCVYELWLGRKWQSTMFGYLTKLVTKLLKVKVVFIPKMFGPSVSQTLDDPEITKLYFNALRRFVDDFYVVQTVKLEERVYEVLRYIKAHGRY